MATEYAERMATNEETPVHDGCNVRVFARVRQFMCGLHGHDQLMQFEKGRLYLQCASCGHESPGWDVTDTPPPMRRRDEANPRVISRPRLVDVRRIA